MLNPGGDCRQIWAEVRENGTDVLFQDCTNVSFYFKTDKIIPDMFSCLDIHENMSDSERSSGRPKVGGLSLTFYIFDYSYPI